MLKTNKKKEKSFILRALDAVEKVGNALPNPTTIFIILSAIVIVISALCAGAGVKVSYEMFDATKKAMVTKEVAAASLLSVEGIRFMVTSVVSNFTGFVALGPVFVIMLGVGVAEGTGFMAAMLKKIAKVTPRNMVTAMVVFLGIMSNIASSTGYVVLVPLGAVLFMSFGRHPIAGLASAFAGVSGGWAANLLIGTNDPVFAGMTMQAANTLDPNYQVLPTSNWYFLVASTFLITIIGTLITEKIIEPRLGTYTPDEEIIVEDVSGNEKRGMKFAGIAELVYLVIMLILVVPQNAILRNPENGAIMKSPFMSGIIFFMMLFFLIPGLFYGIGAKVIKNDKDVIDLMAKAINGLSGYLVLIFFAAQFVAHFNYSNLGTIISVKGASFLQTTGFVGIPLIISFILVTAFINIFIAVDTAKWAMMAPIFVPMFMRIGLSPELTQMAYRIGDSSTNIIAPLMPFFALVVAFCQKYDKKSGMGTLISTMLPYSIAILVGWIAFFILWYLIGLPLGPGAPLLYPIG